MRIPLVAAVSVSLLCPATSSAQESHHVRAPISVGDYPAVNGLRLNFRDRDLERVNGANLTIWTPYDPATGTVKGLAVGLPLTGAGEIDGLATGIFGVGAEGRLRGVILGPIGAGSGGEISGLALGGIGIGAGRDLSGVVLGGVGAGAGGNLKGIIIGGVGAAAGGSARGILVGGIGAGAGGSITGAIVGGVGAGAGGSIRGLLLAGVGSGAGGRISGIAIGGVGLGAGESIRGVALAGIGVGSPRLEGFFAAAGVGAQRAHGFVIAPALFHIEGGGSFRGVTLSSVNDVRGVHTGLAIGLVNYARSLDGVQLGVLNIVADAKSHAVLPLVNWGSSHE